MGYQIISNEEYKSRVGFQEIGTDIDQISPCLPNSILSLVEPNRLVYAIRSGGKAPTMTNNVEITKCDFYYLSYRSGNVITRYKFDTLQDLLDILITL